MSRSHMLYDNKPLQSIPVSPVRWEKGWEPDKVFRLHRFVKNIDCIKGSRGFDLLVELS